MFFQDFWGAQAGLYSIFRVSHRLQSLILLNIAKSKIPIFQLRLIKTCFTQGIFSKNKHIMVCVSSLVYNSDMNLAIAYALMY